MRFDFTTLDNISNNDQKADYTRKILARTSPEDPIFLSDVMVQRLKGGFFVMRELEEMQNDARLHRQPEMTWALLVERDEWGNKLGPGDTVTRTTRVGRKRDGKFTATQDEINMAHLDGSYEKRFLAKTTYEVDDYGCIHPTYSDAAHFLMNWGLHGSSKRTLTTKNEQSDEPLNCPNGSMLHKWYWRYREVTPEEYAELPKRKKEKVLRGITPVQELQADGAPKSN